MLRPPFVPLAALLGCAAFAALGPAFADDRRGPAHEQEAQALARLSLPDLRNYFEARRQLERRSSDQRLAQLRSLEDCLQRTRQRSSADSCLEQARQQRERERDQWMRAMASLRQRYQLPVTGGRQPQGQPGGNHWR